MRVYIFLVLILLSFMLTGQSADSLMIKGREVIERNLRNYEALGETEFDMSELTGVLEYRLEHPLNINEASKSELQELGLLSSIQIKNLLDYRNKYGIFYSIYEIRSIEGFGRASLEKLMPFVRVGPAEDKDHIKKINLAGKHELFLRFQRKLAEQAGFNIPADSLQKDKTSSFYLGDPNRYYLRYTYKSNKHFSWGLTAEKDPGETFIKPSPGIHPDILDEVNKQPGFDFYSAHIALKNLGVIKSLVIGDYHAQFGQGLTLWTGLSFSGGSSPSAFKKFAPMIKPSSSANENSFLRGAAIRLNIRKIELCLFYSRKKTDARLDTSLSMDRVIVTSLPNSGYHRSLNELQAKNTMLQQFFGGHLSYSNNKFRTGITAYKTIFEHGLQREDELANIYRFDGRENINIGYNIEALFRKTILYGEASASMNQGWAILLGLTHNTTNGSIIGVQFREYRKNYQSILAGAYGIQRNIFNERGIRLGAEIPLWRDLSLSLYSEHYVYPWLTSSMINVLRGMKNEMIIDYLPGKGSKLTFKYRIKNTLSKSTDDLDWFDKAFYMNSHKYSVRLRHIISNSFSIKSQFELVIVKNSQTGDKQKGSLLTMDLFFHPLQLPLKISFRYALFNTDDYSARLYAYENDVLYATSMPAYYGKGFRTYLLMKYEAADWLDAWVRFSLTNFTDRNIISSGTSEILGNKVPELKIQLRFKL